MWRRLHIPGFLPGALLLLLAAGAALVPAAPAVSDRGSTRPENALTAAPPSGPLPPIAPPARNDPLGAGRLLVATPRLAGPIFGQTVVLLLDYDTSGAIGVILNRPTSLSLSEIFPSVDDLKARRDRVYLGGPVAPSSMAFLIRGEKKPPESYELMDDIHMSGSALALEYVVESKTPPNRFHAFVGYSGWAPGQLDAEVERGDWWVVPAKPELIFDTDPDDLWQLMISTYGGVQVERQTPPRPAGAS